jgi:alkylhydroperoxidase/carboxymuconolactone decarboxylase family protein YurZ
MTIEELLSAMAQEAGETPIPMQLLSQLDESVVFEHASNKQWTFNKTAVPAKYKLLMSITAAAALGQENCIKTYVKSAVRNGISKDEIMEALLVARFVKATTVISASVDAMQILVENEANAD